MKQEKDHNQNMPYNLLLLGSKKTITKKDEALLAKKDIGIFVISTKNQDTQSLIKNIASTIKNHAISHIILNLDTKQSINIQLKGYLEELDYSNIKFLTYADFSAQFLDKIHILFDAENFKIMEGIKHNKTRLIAKRIMDFTISLLMLGVFSPLILCAAILIKLTSKGSIFFGHKRIGKDGKFFRMYKFRTMTPNAEQILEQWLKNSADIRNEYEKKFKLKNDPRVTKTGNFLRKTSLDEIPQLFNVLIGDMSIVGPRPIVEKELAKYGKYATKLHSVKPGIAGIWQAKGRSDLTYQTRVKMDMEYIDTQSIRRDIKIIFQTLIAIIRKTGAY